MKILDILRNTPVASLSTDHLAVVEVPTTVTPTEGFELLLASNVLSAPVWDESKQKYVGFLEMRDLVSFVVFLHGSECEGGFSFVNIIKEGLKSFNSPVEGITVSYLARRNPFKSVAEDATLYDVAKLLAGPVHRVPVVDSTGRCVKVLSQSTVVRFFDHHLRELPYAKKSVADLRLGTSPVEAVAGTEPAIEVFKLLEKHNRTGVAVVDNTGRLIGATTGHDLKLFLKNPDMRTLHVPIRDFLKTIRMQAIDIKSPTISVRLGDSLGTVIGKLAATRVHRVFVVESDESYSPVRVVSVTDILKEIIAAEESKQ